MENIMRDKLRNEIRYFVKKYNMRDEINLDMIDEIEDNDTLNQIILFLEAKNNMRDVVNEIIDLLNELKQKGSQHVEEVKQQFKEIISKDKDELEDLQDVLNELHYLKKDIQKKIKNVKPTLKSSLKKKPSFPKKLTYADNNVVGFEVPFNEEVSKFRREVMMYQHETKSPYARELLNKIDDLQYDENDLEGYGLRKLKQEFEMLKKKPLHNISEMVLTNLQQFKKQYEYIVKNIPKINRKFIDLYNLYRYSDQQEEYEDFQHDLKKLEKEVLRTIEMLE